MFEAVIDKITSDASSELFFLLSGSLILYIFQRVYTKAKDIRYKLRLRSEIAAYKKRKDAINVVAVIPQLIPEFK
ncbi:hypothetical protein VCSRO193_3524 [Vibrio cholerae]|nr:hypothetical protein VCSRO193_3524 [Vibrio cholerae]